MISVVLSGVMACEALLLGALAVRRREWRGGLLAMAFVFLGIAVDELGPFWESAALAGLDEPEVVPIAVSLALAAVCAAVWRGSTTAAFAEVIRNRRFFLFVWGVLFVSVLPNAAKSRSLWELLVPSLTETRTMRNLAEEMTQVFGHFLLLNWVVLFIKDEWDRFVHRLSPHEHLLRGHELVEIGRGARRVCYRIGETGFCVKFLREPADGQSGRKVGWRFRQMLKNGRFNRRLNVNCLEADAMNKYRQEAGPLVASAFPETVEVVFDERRGYGVLMSCLTNADGSRVIRAEYEMAKRRDPAFAADCCRRLAALFEELIAAAAPFFEPANVQVQFRVDGTFRLRLIDFEPVDKKLVPITEWLPLARRLNLRRKADRYLDGLRRKHGVPNDGGRADLRYNTRHGEAREETGEDAAKVEEVE